MQRKIKYTVCRTMNETGKYIKLEVIKALCVCCICVCYLCERWCEWMLRNYKEACEAKRGKKRL